MGQQGLVPDYTAAQLKDRKFVQTEVAKYDSLDQDCQARLRSASPLLATAIDKDCRRIRMVLEALRYVVETGYDSHDPKLKELAYFKRSPAPAPAVKRGRGLVSTAEDLESPDRRVRELSTSLDSSGMLTVYSGQEMNLRHFLAPGKRTILFFTTSYGDPTCSDCTRLRQSLQSLQSRSEDLKVVAVEAEMKSQPGTLIISPVLKQFDVPGLPYFIIYSPEAMRESQGEEAHAEVNRLIAERVPPNRPYR